MNSKRNASLILINIAFSSAVVAALITSLFSYKSMRETNMQLIKLEKMRISSDINTFRYTKIYSALAEIQNLPSIDYTYLKQVDGKFVQDKELFKEVVEQTTERYYRIRQLYDKVKPLINTKLLIGLETEILEEERQSKILLESLYNNNSLPLNIDIVTLSEVRRNIEVDLKKVLVSQVSALTNQIQQENLEKDTPLKYPHVADTDTSKLKQDDTSSEEKSVGEDKLVTSDSINSQIGSSVNRSQKSLEEKLHNSFVTRLTVWAEVDANIFVDGIHKMRIDHRSGFDYAAAKVRVSPKSIITIKASPIEKAVSLWSLCDENSEGCKVRVGTQQFSDIQISEEEKRNAMGNSSDIPTLVRELEKEVKYSARAWAAQRLGYIGDKEAVSSLLRALQDPEPYVQAMAAEALGRIADPSVLPKLEKAYAVHEQIGNYGYIFKAAIRDLKFAANKNVVSP